MKGYNFYLPKNLVCDKIRNDVNILTGGRDENNIKKELNPA